MASNAPAPRRGLAVAAFAAAVLVAVAAAATRPAGAPPPPPAAIRQADDAPDTVLPMADLLAKHCNGTVITDDTEAERNTTASWTGDCTLVLAVPGGELTWGPGTAATIDGAVVIRLADGAPPAPPPGEDNDDGEVEWEAGSVLRAASLTVTARDIEVGPGALLAATDASGMSLSAAGDVDLEAGAVVRTAAGPVSIAATGDVSVSPGGGVAAAGGAVTITAGGDVDMGPGTSASAGGDMTIRAAAAATLNTVSLRSGGVLTVAAPSCTAVRVTATAPTAQVCD